MFTADAFTAVIPVAVILLASEVLWRKKIVKGERARKFIHILAGSYMAFWPFYISFEGVYLLGAASILVLMYSKMMASILEHIEKKSKHKLKGVFRLLNSVGVFHAIYAVKRRTYGDIFLAIAVMLCALLTDLPWAFTTSILMISVADGLAAVAGRYWGLSNRYYVLGWKVLEKSYAGTAVFLASAYFVVLIGWLLGGSEVMSDHLITTLLFIPVGSTVLENISPYGLDNVVTPLFVVLMIGTML